MKPVFSIPLLLAAGCTVMVNGKPRRIGGSDPAQTPAVPTAQAPAAPPTAAPPTTKTTGPQAPAPKQQVAPSGQVIKVPATLTAMPIVTRVQGTFDNRYSKVHGNGNSPDCGNDITSTPIASVLLDKPMAAMHLAVVGGSNDGFVLRRGDQLWFSCTHSTNQVPTVSKLAEGWQPGRYDIYPVSRYGKGAGTTFTIELFDPATPAPWSDTIKKVSIAGKLPAPMLVEVTTKPNRSMLRSEHAGWGCDKVALPAEPDLQLVLERPVPGLIVRPLPTTSNVTIRRELRDAKRPDRGCPKHERRSIDSNYTPSYHHASELHFDRDDEGTYGISIGTADDRVVTVTLLVYDPSTKLDPFAAYPYPGDAGALDRRWLGFYFPQLDLRQLSGTRDHSHSELTAKLWAAAPKQVFVYSKLDLDKDIASGSSEAFPKKSEPMLVLDVDQSRAEVLTADGLRFHVKLTHLLLKPDGEAVLPAAPRPLRKLDIGGAISLLPPSAKGLVTAREKRLDAYEKCVDRTWAPYGRQLPTITRPSGVDVVYYESARTKNIRAAGEAAVDRACGTDEQQAKRTEAERVKMLAEVEKARVKLLAVALAGWRQ